MSKKDRRAHPRILLGDKVKFGKSEPIFDGVSYDLSPNGISIISEDVLPVQSKIIITIYSDIAGTITVEGEVIWINSLMNLPSKMGIKFNKSYPRLIEVYRTKSRYKS
jgi:hypothetical protein